MITRKGVEVPADLAEALRQRPDLWELFESMPPSHQREYISYILEAKKPETRAARVMKSLDMIADWGKYAQKKVD